MSTCASASEPSSWINRAMTNIHHLGNQLPFIEIAGNCLTQSAIQFHHLTESSPASRLIAIITAIIIKACALFAITNTLNLIPIYFVKKFLIPAVDIALQSGVSWVTFKALSAASDRGFHSSGQPNHLYSKGE